MAWRTLVAVVVLNGCGLGAAWAADDYGRNAWNYSASGRSGSFTRNGDGWIEVFEFKGKEVSVRGRDRYDEAARTDDYVELTGDRSRSMRLYADRVEKRVGDGDWTRLSTGAWTDAPSNAGSAGARPGKSGASSASQKAPPQVWSFAKGNKTGSFTKTADGWDQQTDTKVNDRVVSEHRQFREQSQTSDYVELTDGQDFTIRLYADRAEVDSGNDTWRPLYNGSWDTSASATVAGAGQSVAASGGTKKPAQAAAPERNLWKWENQKNASGTLTRTATGWREDKVIVMGNSRRTEMMTYRETASTPEYIEMIDDSRNVINRCYDDHTEWRFGNGPWNKEWQGGWVPKK